MRQLFKKATNGNVSDTFHFLAAALLLAAVSLTPIHANDDPLPSQVKYPHMPYLNWNPGPEYDASTRPFQGCPSLAVAPGGRLWAFWLTGGVNEGPDNYVVLVTSGDGGETWSEPRLVIDPPYRASEPGAWVDPSGRLWQSDS
jgi:hypothetical protein